MNITRAMLCINCDEIVEAGTPSCPACTGETFFPLSRFLNRPVTTQTLTAANNACVVANLGFHGEQGW